MLQAATPVLISAMLREAAKHRLSSALKQAQARFGIPMYVPLSLSYQCHLLNLREKALIISNKKMVTQILKKK